MHLHPHLTQQLVADRHENLRREFLTSFDHVDHVDHIDHGTRRAGATRRRREAPVAIDVGRTRLHDRWHRRRTARAT
ncbi:MAG: hypothetical protein NTZ21_10370 [Actinobacteria bacterium]|nr:hypothetical protein [Actinomycetota bacterium]